MEVVNPDLEKQREANKKSYQKHREKRLKERKEKFEDTEERIRKNTLGRSYYWERREEVLAQKKEKWEARTDDEKKRQQEYQKEYYRKNKEERKLIGKIVRAEKPAVVKPTLRKVGRPPAKAVIKKSKAPRQYEVYDTTKTLPPCNTLEKPHSYYQQKLLKEYCPLGFFQLPESPNPFHVVF